MVLKSPILGPQMDQNAFLLKLRPRNASKVVKTIYDLDFNIYCGNLTALSYNGIRTVGPHDLENPHFGAQIDQNAVLQ